MPLIAMGKDQDTGQKRCACATDSLLAGNGAIGEAVAPLVDNIASPLFTVVLADGEMASGTAAVSIHVSDGTDHQILTTICRWAAIKKGGVVTADVSSAGGDDAFAFTTGTLATVGVNNGFTVTTTATTAVFKMTANTSLTPISMDGHVFMVRTNHGSTVSIP